jgi:hypothetical protein
MGEVTENDLDTWGREFTLLIVSGDMVWNDEDISDMRSVSMASELCWVELRWIVGMKG